MNAFFNKRKLFLLSMIFLGHCTASFAAQDSLWETTQEEYFLGKKGAAAWRAKKITNPKTHSYKEKCSFCTDNMEKQDVRKTCTQCNAMMCTACFCDTLVAVTTANMPNRCIQCRKNDCYNFRESSMADKDGTIMFLTSKKLTDYAVANRNNTIAIWSSLFNIPRLRIALQMGHYSSQSLNADDHEEAVGDSQSWLPIICPKQEFGSIVAIHRDCLKQGKDMQHIIASTLYDKKYAAEFVCDKSELETCFALLQRRQRNPEKIITSLEEIESEEIPELEDETILNNPFISLKKWVKLMIPNTRVLEGHERAVAVRADCAVQEGYKLVWMPSQTAGFAFRVAIPKYNPLERGSEEVSENSTWRPFSPEFPNVGVKRNNNC